VNSNVNEPLAIILQTPNINSQTREKYIKIVEKNTRINWKQSPRLDYMASSYEC